MKRKFEIGDEVVPSVGKFKNKVVIVTDYFSVVADYFSGSGHPYRVKFIGLANRCYSAEELAKVTKIPKEIGYYWYKSTHSGWIIVKVSRSLVAKRLYFSRFGTSLINFVEYTTEDRWGEKIGRSVI
mgnify:CR=1 FL=1